MAGQLTSFNFLTNHPRGFGGDTNLELGPPSVPLIGVFNTIRVVGFALLMPVLFTALLSRNVRRSATWFSFIASWMFSCVPFFLIIGRQSGPEPGFGICLFQAMLVYAAPPLTAFSSLASLIQLYLGVWSMLMQVPVSLKRIIFLLVLPPIIFIIVCVEVLALGLQDPDSVKRNQTGTYCHITTGTPEKVTATLNILAMFGILCFKGMLAITLYRNWSTFRHMHIRPNSVPFSMIIRFFLFTFVLVLALVLDLIYIPYGTKAIASLDIAIGTLPIATALVFGSQRDIISAWIFWKKKSKSDDLELIQAKAPYPQMLA